MKKILLVCLTLFIAVSGFSQELPYSKYINYSKSEFKENNFKYHKNTNTWYLQKTSGLNVTLNILLIITDSYEDVRPAHNDYKIIVQLGEDDKVSCIRVIFYNDDTYHKLLTFVKRNCKDLIDVSSGKITKYESRYGDYDVELKIEQNIISRTSSRTADPRTLKNVDESYNEYEFVIRTDVEPWSKRLAKQAKRQAKRDAKGKKKKRVEDMM